MAKIVVTSKSGKVTEFECEDFALVVGGLTAPGQGAATMMESSLPFALYAHDQICGNIKTFMDKKEAKQEDISDAFFELLEGLFNAAAGNEGKPH